MTPEEQIDLWVIGESVHNPYRNECCPDFSCCHPQLLAPFETRVAFKEHPEQRDSLLYGFLSAGLSVLLKSSNKKVHVVDPDKHGSTEQ